MKTVTPPKVRVKKVTFDITKSKMLPAEIVSELAGTTRELASVRAELALDDLHETLLQLDRVQKRVFKMGISAKLMAEQVRVALESTKAAMTEMNYVRLEGTAAERETRSK